MLKRFLKLPLILTGLFILSFIFIAKVSAQLVVQSYSANETMQQGLIVSLATNSSKDVIPAVKTAEDTMFGVVTTPSASPISLSGSGTQQVFVANSGNYQVLVDNQNGAINAGDYITISSLDGIGMKATDTDSYVIGKALSAFNPVLNSIGSTTLTATSGAKSTVQIGRVLVAVGFNHNPLEKPSHSDLPSFIVSAGDTISGKQVSTSRLTISFVVLLISCAITASLLYSGVRTAFIAIGRNPLSKPSIYKGMIQVIITSVIVFIIGLLGVYLLLKV